MGFAQKATKLPQNFCFHQLLFPPRVTQLNCLQWLVLWSVPSRDQHSQQGPGSSAVWADNSCLVGGRAALSGWQHLSESGASCQHLTRNPWTKRNDSIVLHKCGIAPRHRFSEPKIHRAQSIGAVWRYSVCLCVVQHGLGLLLSLSASLHLSHDFPDSGSPGVSHLGHQLHSQVNCSSKWSAKQCRKKKRSVIAMIHHRAHITGAWQDQTRTPVINKRVSGVRDSLELLNILKKWKLSIYKCIKHASLNPIFPSDLQ